MRHFFTLLLATLAAAAWGTPRDNVLTLKQSISDTDIVFPESFETDTHEMMKNWYLQNYTILDYDVEDRPSGNVSEEEYIKRLAALPTVIEMPYNQIVRSYIDRYVQRNRTLVEEMLGMSLYYMPIFEQALEREGLPLELKYLPVIESALNPNAVSRAGAAGLWQFMVGTGKGLGLEVNSLVDERRDPYRASEKAATYLKDLYSIYDDWSLAIAAYNCGPANVNKALKRAGGGGKDFWEIYQYLPRETRGYVPAFIAANYVMTYYKHHNISPALARKPLITDTVTISNRVNFNQIAHVLNLPIEEIRILNPQYRQDVIPGNARPYTLALPSQQIYSYILSEDSILAYRSDLYRPREVVEPTGASESDENTYETRDVVENYKVKRGETAASIAQQYGMTTSDFCSLNNIRDGKVRHGQIVKVQTRKRIRMGDDDAADELLARHDGTVPKAVDEADPDDESAQIDEVRRVERAAEESRSRGPRRVHIETPATTAATKSSAAPRSESQQAHQRNQRYSDNRNAGRARSQEDNYKQSRSSKRGDSAKRGRQGATAASAKPAEHTVQKGESLTKIAEKNGVSVEELRKANGITGDNIKAGENLTIPGKGNTAAKTGGKGSGNAKATSGSQGRHSGKSTAKSGSKATSGKSSKPSGKATSTAKSGGNKSNTAKSAGKSNTKSSGKGSGQKKRKR